MRLSTFRSNRGLTPPPPSALEQPADELAAKPGTATSLPTVRLTAGDGLQLDFSFKLPTGYKLNKDAPITCRLRTAQKIDWLTNSELERRHHATLEGDHASVSIRAAAKPGRALLEVALSFTYCRDGVGGLCKLGSGHWTVPIEVSTNGGERSVRLTAEVATN